MQDQRLHPSNHPAPYDCEANRTGVVHLGIGAFHRAHQAMYFDALMAAGERDWKITAASLRSPNVSEQLTPQAGLYTVVIRDGDKQTSQVCHAVDQVLVAPQNPKALIEAMVEPSVALVTLTITEKGYCIDPASGALDRSNPDVQADLDSLDRPRTAPGFILAALDERRRSDTPPFTVLSCDNLPENGKRTRHAILTMAQAVDPELALWIRDHVAFPSSMVDRIVPATTDADIEHFRHAAGYIDLGMVKTEPFCQWVVEDNFCNRRPPLETVGVQMTEDVQAWENAKLRLLNGAHSALSYLGNLAGHEFVHQAINAPGFEKYIDLLWDEAQTTLEPIEGFAPKDYRTQLKARFKNAALEHQTYQIAMDGSQKLPQRLLNTIRARLAAQQPFEALSLGVAAWLRWQSGVNEQGQPYVVQDPLATKTRGLFDAVPHEDTDKIVDNLLGLTEVFGDDLSINSSFRDSLITHLRSLIARGASNTVSNFTDR